jgi:NAD(P)-dependent dehydrogenase (short-subunit alcohol dehydrogenase family)
LQVAREIGGIAVSCDVARAESIAALQQQVERELGVPEILVSNAGIAHSARFVDETPERWDALMQVNLRGAFLATRAVLPGMLAKRRGRIVCVASLAGKVGFKYTAAYCASKHGLLGMVRALALELGETGVTVNAVCPGWTESPMADAAVANIATKTARSPADARHTLAEMSPQRRLLRPEEVADVVAFLCSDEAAGICGQAWNVEAGNVTA